MTVTTDFSIKLESNPSVYIDGSVDRNDKLGEDCDWHYYDKNNFLQLGHPTISHDDVDELKGATQEQEAEIFDFKLKYEENCEEIGDIILQCDFENVFYDKYQTKRYGLIIEVTSIETDCKFDSHDFLGGYCDNCGECGFTRWE